jgi:hypothetical protein
MAQAWTVGWMWYDGEIQVLSCLSGGLRSVRRSIAMLQQNVLVLPNPS